MAGTATARPWGLALVYRESSMAARMGVSYEKEIISIVIIKRAPSTAIIVAIDSGEKKYLYAHGYFQRREAGLWQGCEGDLCRLYKEGDQSDNDWIHLTGVVPELGKEGTVCIPRAGGQGFYYTDKTAEWVTWYNRRCAANRG